MKLEFSVMNNKTATIKGVKAIDAFDDQRFSLSTVGGMLVIIGNSLKLRKWEADQHTLVIEGEVGGIIQANWLSKMDLIMKSSSDSDAPKGMLSAWKAWFR
jgi:hypothetical protein